MAMIGKSEDRACGKALGLGCAWFVQGIPRPCGQSGVSRGHSSGR